MSYVVEYETFREQDMSRKAAEMKFMNVTSKYTWQDYKTNDDMIWYVIRYDIYDVIRYVISYDMWYMVWCDMWYDIMWCDMIYDTMWYDIVWYVIWSDIYLLHGAESFLRS